MVSNYTELLVSYYSLPDGKEKNRVASRILPLLYADAKTIAMKHNHKEWMKYGDDMIYSAVYRLMLSKVNVSTVRNWKSYVYTSFRNSYKNYIKLKMNRLNIDSNITIDDLSDVY